VALKPDEQELLEKVLSVAGDMELLVYQGITVALRGVHDRARRVYLRNILSRAAKQKIRAARKKHAAA
jgi:hypothetical protein